MLNIEPGLMIWTLITFGIAVFILWRYAFGPLQKIIDQRRLLEEYKATLAKVRGESEDILERSRTTAEHAKSEILADAKAQSDRILEKAHEQIERDTRAALRDIKGQIAELTALATEKVAASSLSAADQQRLIDEALAELDIEKLGAEGTN
jgi:F-type H+-transporting ATPase subunit b